MKTANDKNDPVSVFYALNGRKVNLCGMIEYQYENL